MELDNVKNEIRYADCEDCSFINACDMYEALTDNTLCGLMIDNLEVK